MQSPVCFADIIIIVDSNTRSEHWCFTDLETCQSISIKPYNGKKEIRI